VGTAAWLLAGLVLMPIGASTADTGNARETTFVSVAFGDLPGWSRDDHAAAFKTFLKSCARVTSLAERGTPAGRAAPKPGLLLACGGAAAAVASPLSAALPVETSSSAAHGLIAHASDRLSAAHHGPAAARLRRPTFTPRSTRILASPTHDGRPAWRHRPPRGHRNGWLPQAATRERGGARDRVMRASSFSPQETAGEAGRRIEGAGGTAPAARSSAAGRPGPPVATRTAAHPFGQTEAAAIACNEGPLEREEEGAAVRDPAGGRQQQRAVPAQAMRQTTRSPRAGGGMATETRPLSASPRRAAVKRATTGLSRANMASPARAAPGRALPPKRRRRTLGL